MADAGYWASALFDYAAVEDTEISVTKGDQVFIEESNDSGWCLARRGDSAGWIPTDYVQRLTDQPPPPAAGYSDDTSGVTSFQQQRAEPTPTYTKPAATAAADDEVAAAMQTLTTSGASDSKTCYKCKGRIDSAFVVAKDKSFHADCFRCNSCKTPLGGKAFIEKDDGHFCESCYYTSFNPKCAHCNEIIKGPYISALGKSWHPDHFVCTECSAPFQGNQFHKHGDRPYCEKHFNQLFAEKCGKCNKTIEGQVFEALDRKYHLECFTCTVGDHKIGEGVNFHVHDEKIYCPNHFEELFLQRCVGCSQIIKGQYVKVLDSIFHPQCWKCSDCQIVINSDNCGQAGGKFYCRNCVGKRGGVGGPIASGPIATSPAAVVSSPVTAYSAPAAATAAAKPKEEKAPAARAAAPSTSAGPVSTGTFYSYDVLKQDVLPADVDSQNKEMYLSDEVFLKMFKMDKATFSKLPDWKKKRLKVKVELF